jgi:hypothetical protein
LSSVVNTVVAAQTDMVNVLVQYGYITQDQANTIIADLSARVEAALSAAPVAGYTGYGYGCFGIVGSGSTSSGSVTPTVVGPVTGYGYGMMGGIEGSVTVPGTSYGYGMMGW